MPAIIVLCKKCDDTAMSLKKSRGALPNRLREVREAADLTQEGLAERLGKDHSTIWRWESGRGFDLQQAATVAPILGCAPIDFFVTPPKGRMVTVSGKLQAGVWRQSSDIPEDSQTSVVVPDLPALARSQLYAAEVVGESMNLVYPPGTIVVLERIFPDSQSLIPNKRYHVEIQRADGAVESTLKKLERDQSGRWWMAPESSLPEFKSSMQIVNRSGENLAIAGRVVWAIIPEL